jgi:outer membrane receptor protein involved in Fe transport
VFPNAKLTVNLTTRNRLTAAYNRRVDRPGEPELRIFPKYDDPEILKVGNPFLRPQFTNVYEAGFSRSWLGGTGAAALYHRDVSDAFLRVVAIDDSNPNYDIVNGRKSNPFSALLSFRVSLIRTGIAPADASPKPRIRGKNLAK